MELFGDACVARVCAQVKYADGPAGTQAETAADGKLLLGERAGGLAGLEIDLSVRTDSTTGDVYELEVVGERGRLVLKDFCRLQVAPISLGMAPCACKSLILTKLFLLLLQRTAPVEEWLVRRGSYGRVESVDTLVAAMRAGDGHSDGALGNDGQEGGVANASGGLITVRQGRNAQRLLDAILASNGSWIDVTYD